MGRRIIIVFTLLTMHIAAFSQSAPFPADNLAAWYSADSVHLTADNHVDTLYDKSGNERHAIQLTAGKQPTWIEDDEYINHQPTLYFDGNDFLLSVSQDLFSQPNTFFIVWKTDNNKTTIGLSGANDSQRNQIVATGSNFYVYGGKTLSTPNLKAPFNYSIIQSLFNETSSFISCNGKKIANGDAGNFSHKGISIGADRAGGFGTLGNISELIFFNGAISPSDSTAVIEYLLDKYTWRNMCIDEKIIIDYGFAPVEYSPYGWAQTYLWDDGSTTPEKSISDEESHTLTITDVFGFTHSYSVTVKYPTSKQLNDTTICAGDTLVWNAALNGPYTYLWSDGSTESSLEITTAGEYYVTITDNAGYSWKSNTIMVAVDSISSHSIIDDNIKACSGEFISTNQSSDMSFLWNTGDTKSSIAITQSGKYWVKVTDRFGCSVSDTTFVTVNGVAPTTDFTHTTVEAGKPTQFQNLCQSNDGTKLNYVWNFDDGSVSNEQNPTHTFTHTGQYEVTLSASSESGCHNSISNIVSVGVNSSLLVETIMPVDSQTIYTKKVIFKWKEIDGCKQYNLQIATDNNFNNLIVDTNVNTTNVSVILENGTFFWRVKTNVGLFNSAKKLYVTPISSINNLAAWYSADSVHLTEDNYVDILYDKSGNERHATQLTTGKQPAWVEEDEYINNQPTLYFDGNDFLLSVSQDIFSQPNTFFIVWKTNNNKTAIGLSGTNDSQRNQIVATGSNFYVYGGKTLSTPNLKAPFNYSIIQSLFNETSSFISCNGKKIANGDAGNFSHKGISIGADRAGGFGTLGNISELIFFNGAISPSDSTAVIEYLLDKYTWRNMCIDEKIIIDYGFAPVEYSPYGWAQAYLWDDGSTTPGKSISDGKAHTLTITDVFGFTHSYSVTAKYPTSKQLHDTTICAGDTLVWNAALNGPYSYLWSNGSTESSLEITTAGEYWVTITDTAGYSWKSDMITVSVDSFPVTARLAGDNITACIGNNIYLQTGFDEATSYLWSDGSKDDHLAVTTSGTYWVRAANKLGCIATDTAQIEVLGIAPTPDFTHTALCATRSIEFENQSHSNDTSKINGYLWQFGDGGTSTAANPVHAYSYSGTYSMQLIVSTTNGCSNVLKKNLIIDSLPTAAFVPAQACSYTNVQFTDLSSTPVGYLTEWQWTMNDSVFADRNPHTTFNAAGDMPVQLVVTTSHGCTDTLRSTISILQGPVVDFYCSTPCLNTPLYCTNKTISAMSLAISYIWQIDGEEQSSAKSPDFNLSDTGSYQITLIAKQLSNGCSASKSKTINIRPLPKPIISAGLICQNQPVHVKAENIEPGSVVDSWQWTIDGTQNAKGQTKMLTFESEGKHRLTVTATDTVGCENKTDTAVVVRPTPSAAFSITPERGPVPFEPTFINRSADADSYQWVLDNTFASADEELQYTFADSGSHVVGLIAVNQYGCADTALRTMVAFVPSTDLLIMQAEAEPVGNYLRISAVVANNSPYDLVNLTISYTDNLGHSIRETITDTIKTGKIIQYTFTSEVELVSNLLKYICVNVEPATGSDESPANNQFCIAMSADEFSAEPAKPNPADNRLKISYIVPQDGPAKIELFNQVGTPVAIVFDGTATAGYNEIIIDASSLKSGMYHYRITYDGHSRTGMVMIMH